MKEYGEVIPAYQAPKTSTAVFMFGGTGLCPAYWVLNEIWWHWSQTLSMKLDPEVPQNNRLFLGIMQLFLSYLFCLYTHSCLTQGLPDVNQIAQNLHVLFSFWFSFFFFFFSFFDIYIQQRQEAQNDNPTRLWILRRMFLNVRTSISKQCGLPPHVQHFVSFRLTVQYFWHAVDDAPKIVWEHACCVFSDS